MSAIGGKADIALGSPASPLVMASRLLIAQRFDPNSIIEMWHCHADAWALRGRLGAVAAVIIDGEKKPTQPAKNGPPVQFSEEPNVEDRRESRAQWATHFAARRGRMEAD